MSLVRRAKGRESKRKEEEIMEMHETGTDNGRDDFLDNIELIQSSM